MSDILLNQMLPNSLDKSKMLRTINEVLQPYLDENWEELIPRLFLYSRIDELPEEFLNHLGYQLHVDFWEPDLPIEKKRKLIKNSIKYHKHKGTPYAVEQLLSDVFDDTWLKEWFEYGGDPYYFKVYIGVKDENTKIDLNDSFIRALNTVKNTRSWLESINIVNKGNIILKEKTDTYTNRLYPVSTYHQCGTIFRHQYVGKKINSNIKIPNSSAVRGQRQFNVGEIKSGGVKR